MTQTIIIDEEFKGLLPELGRATFELLEENILQNGCRDSLVLWGDILIDGHNRYEICMKHDIPFNTISMEFGSRDEVLIWIISTQVSRRNMTPIQLAHYRGLHYEAEKRVQGTYDRVAFGIESGQNVHFQNSTAGQLSEHYNVNPKTIRRDGKVAVAIDAIGKASPAAKKMVLSGEVNVGKQVLEALASKSQEFIEEVALQIEDGSFDRKTLDLSSPDEKGGAGTAGSGAASAAPKPYAVISSLTSGFNTELRRLTKVGDALELKAALRAYIDMLEDYYKQI